MKTIILKLNQIEIINDYPKPVLPEGEALIRIRMAGICRTDLELAKGYMGFEGIPGHEFVGEIAHNIDHWKAGERVVGEINAGCGDCEWCRKGMERHCFHRSVLGIFNRNGCMAEWMTLPIANLYKVPNPVPDRWAVFTEPIAAVLEIFEQILITPSSRVCILGDGKLGLLTAMIFACRHEGEILLVGHHEENLAVVSDRISTCLEKDLPEKSHKSWDVVVEATGRSSGLEMAMRLARPRGTIVLKSTMARSDALDLTPIVIDEITVVGSRCGLFAPALSLLEKDVLWLDRIIEATYPIDKALEAWQCASRPGAGKVLLQIT